MSRIKLVDPESYNLACHFLGEEANITEVQRMSLATDIQQAVEDWLADFNAKAQGGAA